MRHFIRRIVVVAALGLFVALSSGVSVSPAGAQELDLCAILGGEYCPEGYVPPVTDDGNVANANNAALARTGSSFGPLLGIAAGLLLLGGAAAYTARRRPDDADKR